MRNKRFIKQEPPKPLFEEVASLFPVFNQYMTNIHRQEKEKLLHILKYSLSDDEKKNTLLNEIKPLNEELKKLPLSSMIINDLNTQTDLIKFAEYWITIDTQIIKTLMQEWNIIQNMDSWKKLETDFLGMDISTHINTLKENLLKKFSLQNSTNKKITLPYIQLANQHTAKVMDKKGSIEKNKPLEDLPPFDDGGLPDLMEFDWETTDTPTTLPLTKKPSVAHYEKAIADLDNAADKLKKLKETEIYDFIGGFFFIHYKMRYQIFLIDQLETCNKIKSEVENNTLHTPIVQTQKIEPSNLVELPNEVEPSCVENNLTIIVEKELSKIEWLGTSKQLLDLFTNLCKKNWFEGINFDLIEKFFTESENIRSMDLSKVITFKDIKTNPKANTKLEEGKISWLGTQKNLAELFIELHRKQWISPIPIPLITTYFTNSKTIATILRPSYSKYSKKNEYQEVYTPNYKAFFDKIPENTNR